MSASTSSPGRRRGKQPEAPRTIGGVVVLSETPVPSNLPHSPPTKVIAINLADGNTLFGCADCADVIDATRGEIMKHRAEKHGKGWPGYLRPTKNTSAADLSAMLGMTIAEVLEMTSQAQSWAALNARLEDQVENWRDRAMTAERQVRNYEATFRRLGFIPREEVA